MDNPLNPLDLDQHEQQGNSLEDFVGKKVRHVWGTGVLIALPKRVAKKMGKEHGVKVVVKCAHRGCHTRITIYTVSGCHEGAYCYATTAQGDVFVDLRNSQFVCKRHG